MKEFIRDVKDFPIDGIVFRDLTPLFRNPDAFEEAITQLDRALSDVDYTSIVAIESRGFVVGAALAYKRHLPLVLVRKKEKLPPPVYSLEYNLEYGTATLEIGTHALKVGEKVLIVDDLLATGGTATATAGLVEQAGAIVVAFGFLVELTYLHGINQLKQPVVSLVKY